MRSNLECIDLATMATFNKYRGKVSDHELYLAIVGSFKKAILRDDYTGFTSSSPVSRAELREVGASGFKTELLRHVPKIMAYKKLTNDPAQYILPPNLDKLSEINSAKFPLNYYFESAMFDELQRTMYQEGGTEHCFELLNNNDMLDLAVYSFVVRRYEEGLGKKEDEALGLVPQCNEVANAIDAHYARFLSDGRSY